MLSKIVHLKFTFSCVDYIHKGLSRSTFLLAILFLGLRRHEAKSIVENRTRIEMATLVFSKVN